MFNTPFRITCEYLQIAANFSLEYLLLAHQRYAPVSLSTLSLFNLLKKLLKCLYVASKRITLPEIRKYPWFLKNLPKEIAEGEKRNYNSTENNQSTQSVDEIMRIIQEAQKPADGSKAADQSASGLADAEDVEADAEAEAEEVDSSGEFFTRI